MTIFQIAHQWNATARSRRARIRVGVLLLAPLISVAAAPRLHSKTEQQGNSSSVAAAPQPQGQRLPPGLAPDMTPPPLTAKQQRDLLKANYQKMKQEVDELAGLAKSLQDELNKSNQNILSLQIVDKADKIEKLAKKIKSEAVR
jgi:hypothetical protein